MKCLLGKNLFSDSLFLLKKTFCFLIQSEFRFFPEKYSLIVQLQIGQFYHNNLNSFNFVFSSRNYKWNLRNIPPISVGDGCLASLPTCVQRDRSPPRPLMSFSARNSFWEHRAIFRSSSCKKQYQWDYGLCIFHSLGRSRNSTIILWLLVCSLLASSAGTTFVFWIARVGEWGENREWQWWQLLVFLFSFSRSQTPRGQCNRYKRSCRWRRLAQFSLFTLVYNIYTVYSNGGMK